MNMQVTLGSVTINWNALWAFIVNIIETEGPQVAILVVEALPVNPVLKAAIIALIKALTGQ